MTLEDRIGRLERQNRWMKCAAVTAIGLFVTLGQSKPQDIITARGFAVVDEKGKLRGMFNVAEGEASLWLNDKKNGKPVVGLSSEPAMIMLDGNEHGRIALGVSPGIEGGDKGPGITLFSKHGQVQMQVARTGGTQLSLQSESALREIVLTASKEGAGVTVKGKEGTLFLGATDDEDGPSMVIVDPTNKALFRAP